MQSGTSLKRREEIVAGAGMAAEYVRERNATLIANRIGFANRQAAFWSLVHDLRAEYDLAEE